jgi:hypothetical protein
MFRRRESADTACSIACRRTFPTRVALANSARRSVRKPVVKERRSRRRRMG